LRLDLGRRFLLKLTKLRGGWLPDGRIFVRGHRYFFSLWQYQRSKAFLK
jgi:hypothetical protein